MLMQNLDIISQIFILQSKNEEKEKRKIEEKYFLKLKYLQGKWAGLEVANT